MGLVRYGLKTKFGGLMSETVVCPISFPLAYGAMSADMNGSAMLIVDGKRLEGIGVEPDIEVPFDIRFAAGRDIQLERAKDEMVTLIESSQ